MKDQGFARTYSTGDIATLIPAATPEKIEFWVRQGLIIPERSTGRGVPRGYPSTEVIFIAQAADLTTAGLSTPQLQQFFTFARSLLAQTPPVEREWRLFAAYISSCDYFAKLFGRPAGYDEWRAEAVKYLLRMKRFARIRAARTTTRPEDAINDDAEFKTLIVGLARTPCPLRLRDAAKERTDE